MRTRDLLKFAVPIGVVGLEILLIASFFGAALDVMILVVQLGTLGTLVFTLYSWERERLDKGYELLEELRVWSNHFYYMTMHLQQKEVHPSQIRTHDEISKITELATETADHLSRALARCAHIIGSHSLLAEAVKSFILKLRKFARNDFPVDKAEYFLSELYQLQPIALEIGKETSSEQEARFKISHAVPLHRVQQIIWYVVLLCSAGSVFLWLRFH